MPSFLKLGATTAQRIQANIKNHLSWFGDDLRYENGVHWKEGLIAFPEMPKQIASQQLDRIIALHREKTPLQIACWSAIPTHPADLAARLVARGFEWGWQPHWMALDLHRIREDFPTPPDLTIVADDTAEWDVDDLPYYTKPEAQTPPSLRRGNQWRFGAYLDGKIVGQSALHLTTGRLGVGGIYNVGVVPSARGQGIGRAISIAACRFARDLGCNYATLNAATPIYDRIGFVSCGYGQTWFLQPEVLAAPPPTPIQVAYFEAVGQGVAALERLRKDSGESDFDASLASGFTLMELAVRLNRPACARWLVKQGATLEIVHAWDFGWKEAAERLLQRSPEAVNRTTGRFAMTPLHLAAERNDIDLARLILTATPDLTIRDKRYNGTPLNWAEVLGRTEIARLIREKT